MNGIGDDMKLNINKKLVEVDVRPDEFLLETLRKLGYLSVKEGCQSSSCGVCGVLLDEKIILSCTYLTVRAEGKAIATLEGVRERSKFLVDFLAEEGADQCGYCAPGLIMAVMSLENELVNPTEEEIYHYLDGNLCRCTGYKGQIRAIKKYLELRSTRSEVV